MNKAFTLIEVLVASVLLCIFSVSFTLMLTTGVKQIRASRSLTRSVINAKSMMEVIRGAPFTSLYSYNNVSFDKGKGSVVVSPMGNDAVSITVYDGVELVTMRSRY